MGAIEDLTTAVSANTLALLQNTAALQGVVRQEKILVADLSLLTNVATQLAADDSALKTSLDAVVAALQQAQAGGFTAQNQADLADAVAKLQGVHADLVADATEAQNAVAPPPAPGP